jgi:uncharacterized protein (TIRG00374 family)
MGKAMPESRSSRGRLLMGLVILLVLIGLLLVVLDWRQVRKIIGHADWRPVPLGLIFAAISYGCISYAFAVVNRLFGIRMPQRALVEVGFVSTMLNHLLGAGGAAGFSVRFLIMGQYGNKTSDIVAASLFASYVNSMGMLAILPLGLIYLASRHSLAQATIVGIGVAAVALILVFALATSLIFVGSLRGALLEAARRLVRAITRRDLAPVFAQFDAAVHQALTAAHSKPATGPLLLALTAVDWACSIVTLAFCFQALGTPLQADVLVTGFAIGMTAGVLSMVPGGLGVQESSMAGIYALLGVPIQQAALAAVLFRLVYYLVPYLISLGLYRRLLRGARRASGASVGPLET